MPTAAEQYASGNPMLDQFDEQMPKESENNHSITKLLDDYQDLFVKEKIREIIE